ncbi:MAG: hypothetical protein DFNUSKGM_001504 [Candidatus Fervidibacter sacchari]
METMQKDSSKLLSEVRQRWLFLWRW